MNLEQKLNMRLIRILTRCICSLEPTKNISIVLSHAMNNNSSTITISIFLLDFVESVMLLEQFYLSSYDDLDAIYLNDIANAITFYADGMPGMEI